MKAITQATAVAKTNRALRTKTTITGQQYYDEGDLVDYQCPTTAKGDWGGCNGPPPVVRADPDRGQVIIRVGNRDIHVQYGDARHSLYIADSVDSCCQATFGETCYDVWLCPDQKGNASDDQREPTISQTTSSST
eukprot:4009374-Pyramimonas_sp.AAC.1